MEKLYIFTLFNKFIKRSNNDTMGLLIDSADCVRKRKNRASGNNSRCSRDCSEKRRDKSGGLRKRIFSKILISPLITKVSSKDFQADMSQVPLMAPESNLQVADCHNMVGLPGDSWTYRVEREQLAKRSEWFRAMLTGPLAPPQTDSPPLLRLQHVDKRAFDHFLRYLHDEPVNFVTVSTARATLDVAHQYLCSELARSAAAYLEKHLTPSNVLEIYQNLGLYANDRRGSEQSSYDRSPNSPSAPSLPENDADEIAGVCTNLLHKCLFVIDANPETVLRQERFDELSVQEVADLARRDTLNLESECNLFSALDRWAKAECRRQGIEPLPANKRAVLSDDICYSVRYLLMDDEEFINGPMASGILTNEECVHIISKILGHPESSKNDNFRDTAIVPPFSLSKTPRIGTHCYVDEDCSMFRPGKTERQDNRKNRRKECATRSQRVCSEIGSCLIEILAHIFD
ncbi:BTB/POZ domain-containing protein 6-A isoform X2 [Linepithema humile]|uniref:BTB/POZ domain-containing protein 6-A isoform X2 n=1 Tax=Linepithema humile TaxID=83485 RepID=UPI0006231E11|nr:PREDICTED: BTB/POZ domain-containing protein 6-A isoform X2 [Linepithema humile]